MRSCTFLIRFIDNDEKKMNFYSVVDHFRTHKIFFCFNLDTRYYINIHSCSFGKKILFSYDYDYIEYAYLSITWVYVYVEHITSYNRICTCTWTKKEADDYSHTLHVTVIMYKYKIEELTSSYSHRCNMRACCLSHIYIQCRVTRLIIDLFKTYTDGNHQYIERSDVLLNAQLSSLYVYDHLH